MSIPAYNAVWDGSRHQSGNFIVLLAIADHADDEGKAWPSIPRLACKARLSQRHTRRCLNELKASGELEILPKQAPHGRTLYRIRLDELRHNTLYAGTPASASGTPMSDTTDAHDREFKPPYIEEPSIKSSREPSSKSQIDLSNRQNPPRKKQSHSPDAIGLVSSPKSGF